MDRPRRVVAVDARSDDEKVPLVDPDPQALRVGAGQFDMNDDPLVFAVDVHIGVRLEAAVMSTPG